MGPNIERGKLGDLEKSHFEVGDISAVENAGKQISSTFAAEKGEDEELHTVGNLMLDRVIGMETSREFLDYCATCPDYRWSSESDVTIKDFKKCLQDFKNAHPEHSHNVIDY